MTHRSSSARITAIVGASALATLPALGASPAASPPPAGEAPSVAVAEAPEEHAEPVRVVIPGTTVEITLVPIPAGTLRRADTDDSDRTVTIDIAPLAISATEITWDAYDIFVFALDQTDPTRPDDADVVARPSKPYLPPDRGFGHAGYPALSMTHHAAEQFCVWLSNKTGLSFRLPTEDEWEYACRAGDSDEHAALDPGTLAEFAWFNESSNWTTHPVGTLAPNGLGLFDMLGNAAEWVQGRDGKPIVCGGSYLDPADAVTAASRQRPTRDWQASDPQIPRSRWWLSDATHVGFRVVCDGPLEGARDQ